MKYKVVIDRKYQSQVRVQLSQIGLDILFNFNDLSIQVKKMNEWIGHLKLLTAWYQVKLFNLIAEQFTKYFPIVTCKTTFYGVPGSFYFGQTECMYSQNRPHFIVPSEWLYDINSITYISFLYYDWIWVIGGNMIQYY